MPGHESKQCPRCAALFECKVGSILLCQCQTVLFTQEQLEYINASYSDCLCTSCLRAVRLEYEQQQYSSDKEKYKDR